MVSDCGGIKGIKPEPPINLTKGRKNGTQESGGSKKQTTRKKSGK